MLARPFSEETEQYMGPSGFIVGFPESGVSPTDERSSFEGEELLVLQQFMAFRRGLPRNARG